MIFSFTVRSILYLIHTDLTIHLSDSRGNVLILEKVVLRRYYYNCCQEFPMWFDWKNTSVKINSAGRARWRKDTEKDVSWAGHVKDYDLWVLWAGNGHFETPQGKFRLMPGSVLWMKPGNFYDIKQDPANTLGMDFIHFNLLDENGKEIESQDPPDYLSVFDSVLVQSISRHIAELMYFGDINNFKDYNLKPGPKAVNINQCNINSSDAMLSATALLTSLLIDLDHFNSDRSGNNEKKADLHHQQIIMKAAMKIREDLANIPGINELARQFGYSNDHFTRIFKNAIGLSPQDYIIKERIKTAEMMLSSSTYNIENIAMELGYCDKYFFSKQFKAKTGLSPREYRKKYTVSKRG